MKIGKLIIITQEKLDNLILKEREKAVAEYTANELPKIYDDIWNTAIDTYSKTPQGQAVVSRRELEEENKQLKEALEDYNNLLWAQKIMNKFLGGE